MVRSVADAFIVGCGNIGRQVAVLWQAKGGEVAALLRTPRKGVNCRVMHGDLDQAAGLNGISCTGSVLFHFAPPPSVGLADQRTARLLGVLEKAPPRRIVYISTSGVYGDCQGRWVDEFHPVRPGNRRSLRRVDAERQLAAFAERHMLPLVILRVPGIYGPGRLPLERLRRGEPVVCPEEAPWSNRIHADDLAAVAVQAGSDNAPAGIYNVSDDQPTSITDYLYQLADRVGLPRPGCVSLAEARRIFLPRMQEYLEESRRLDNRRMKAILRVQLRYPTLATGLRAALAA